MFINYVKIAYRTLWKHKLFSTINIFGLALGMTVCITALVDFKKAFDFDTFHPFADRTYRIITDVTYKENNQEHFASTPLPVAENIYKDYSVAESMVRVMPFGEKIFEGANKNLGTKTYFTDPDFFKIFGFSLSKGQLSNEPRTTVITQETAERFFGKTDAVGQILHHKEWGDFTITGIIQSPLKKSHLIFDVLLSISTVPILEKTGKIAAETNNWTNPWSCYTYLLVKKGSTKIELDKALPAIAQKATQAITAGSNQKKISFRSQPLNETTPAYEDLLNFAGGTTFAKLMVQIGIALLTLLLAGFNYVNLTLARSITRAKEVGVRKVIGAQKSDLFIQFILESMAISVASIGLAILMLQFLKLLPFTSAIFDEFDWNVTLVVSLIAFSLITGLVAGIVPARILSSFKPAAVVKGGTNIPVIGGLSFKKILVVVQFTVSLTGIIFMLIMYRQQSFMAKGEYGFTKENILNIPLPSGDFKVLKNQLAGLNGVQDITAVSSTLGVHGGSSTKVSQPDKQIYTGSQLLLVDNNFVRVLDLKLVAGNNLPVSIKDSAGAFILINERAAKELHFSDARSAVGQLVLLNDSTSVRISGVVQDFHFMSMYFPIFPLVMRYQPQNFKILQVKTDPAANTSSLLNNVKKVFTQLYPHQPFEATWFNEELYARHFHRNDQLMLGLLCLQVLFIACLGLLGMVTYTAEVRTKEVGIRKILGASVLQITTLLSRDFVRLLFLSALIALPLGYISGMFFLNNFAYHITIGAGTLLTGLITLFFAGGITIAWQTIRIAISNPVNSLRSE